MLKKASVEKKRVKSLIRKRNRAELKRINLEITAAVRGGYRCTYWRNSISVKNIKILQTLGYSIIRYNLYNYMIAW